MDISSLIDDTPLSSAQIVGPADALLTDTTDNVLHAQDPVLATSQPAGGGATSPIDGIAPLATEALGALGSGTANAAGANPALLGPMGEVLPETQALSAQPVEQLANNGVLDFHNTLELLAHKLEIADGLHGLTNFGETVGLGHIGSQNLVTDLLDTPTALANGDLSPVMNVPTDLGNIDDAAQLLVSDLVLDAANANAVLTDPVGHLESAIPVLEAFPATALANEAVDAAGGTLGSALDPLLPGTTGGILGLGGGEAGGHNVLSDLTSAPAALLSGDTSPLTNLSGDVAQVGGAAGGLLDGIGSDLSDSSLLGALTHPATGGGILGGDLPGQGIVGTLANVGDGAVNGLGDATGLGGLTQALTGAAGSTTGGSSSPITSLLHVPGDILGGASNGAAPLPGDGGATLGSLGSVVGAAAGGVSHLSGDTGLLAPVTGALSSATSGALGGGGLGDPLGTIAHADPTGLVSAVTGAAAPVTSGGAGGLLGAITGALGSGSGSGSHDLLSVAAGPQTPTSGLGINVLDASPSGQTHLVDTNVGTAGAPAPTLATISVLPDSIQLPTAATGGSDALSGVLQSVTGGGAPASGSASANAGLDLGIVHVDAPIAAAHADPLGALGHAVHLG